MKAINLKKILMIFFSLTFLLTITTQDNFVDISSFANLNEITQDTIDLNLQIDFDNQKLFGNATIEFNILKSTNNIILDSKFLNIFNITNLETLQILDFKLDASQKLDSLGTPLVITFAQPLTPNNKIKILINYETTKDSAAIQWLTPEMTLGKKYPFMFTQCEAILCRSLLPCQDSPSVKVLVSTALTVKNPLVALYAGIKKLKPIVGDKYTTYYYHIKTRIPTYLIAIAAGALESRGIGPRSKVWAEKELVDAAAWEFKETENFIQIAEHYATPYEWYEYNILVLPPGFPYGGMENPCLTFATPSLIAGDRSLANVIAHEISHSWTGNLVTMKDWRNFWLNEGFTVFLERKIIEMLYGEETSKLQAQVGYSGYVQDVQNFGLNNSYTSLFPDIQKNDPDDAFSTVPYEKGFNFLYFLESITGKQTFGKIFKDYIKNFKYKSIVYTDFKEFFIAKLKEYSKETAEDILNKVDWDAWILNPGLPPVKNNFTNIYYNDCVNTVNDLFANKLDSSFNQKFTRWNTNVKLVFLNLISDKISQFTNVLYEYLRDNLKLNSGYNSEVKNLWYQLALNTKHDDVVPYLEDFLSKIGRMKYIRPLYKSYALLNKKAALVCFEKNRNTYHPVAIRLILEDFKKIPDNLEGIIFENEQNEESLKMLSE